jgi:hypothetical protein
MVCRAAELTRYSLLTLTSHISVVGEEVFMAETTKTSISPMFSVRRGVKAIEFYKATFRTTELIRIGDEDCGVVAQMAVAGPSSGWLTNRRNI